MGSEEFYWEKHLQGKTRRGQWEASEAGGWLEKGIELSVELSQQLYRTRSWTEQEAGKGWIQGWMQIWPQEKQTRMEARVDAYPRLSYLRKAQSKEGFLRTISLRKAQQGCWGTHVTSQRSPVSPRNRAAFVCLLHSVSGWERPMGSVASTNTAKGFRAVLGQLLSLYLEV